MILILDACAVIAFLRDEPGDRLEACPNYVHDSNGLAIGFSND